MLGLPHQADDHRTNVVAPFPNAASSVNHTPVIDPLHTTRA